MAGGNRGGSLTETAPAGELLPGERPLWSGGPARARFRLADPALPVYLLGALALVAVTAPGYFRHLPVVLVAGSAVVWTGAALQAVGYLLYLLVLKPRIRRRHVYTLTDWRILVTAGLRVRHTWSAYLDQIDDPSTGSGQDGVADIRLQAQKPPLRRFLAHGDPLAATQPGIPVLHDIVDAAQVRQVIARARRRMLARETQAGPPGAAYRSVPVPEAVTLGGGERTLWTGRAGHVPAWFGLEDIEVSVFGLVAAIIFGALGTLVATSGPAASLVVFIPVGAGALYLAAGRLLLRRVRIRRSVYVLTDRRLITSWRIRKPVVVHSPLHALLPPEIRGSVIFTRLAKPPARRDLDGWKNILGWPAATRCPPVLIGVADPEGVRDLICAAQLASPSRQPAVGQRRLFNGGHGDPGGRLVPLASTATGGDRMVDRHAEARDKLATSPSGILGDRALRIETCWISPLWSVVVFVYNRYPFIGRASVVAGLAIPAYRQIVILAAAPTVRPAAAV